MLLSSQCLLLYVHFSFDSFLFFSVNCSPPQIRNFNFLAQNELYACTSLPRGQGKVFPVQAWTGPEGSRRLRLTYFLTIAI